MFICLVACPAFRFHLRLQAILGMTRVRVYYGNSARQTEQFLRPEAQLIPSQSTSMFKYVVGQHLGERPTGLRPTDPLAHQLAIALQTSSGSMGGAGENAVDGHGHGRADEKDGSDSVGSDNSEKDSDADGDAAEHRQLGPARSTRVIQLEKKLAIKKAKELAKKAEKKAAKAAAKVAVKQVDVTADADVKSTGSKGSTLKDKVKEFVDDELSDVAEAHLNSGKGSSVKCLSMLRVEIFLRGADACGVPEVTSSKTLSAAMTGVRNSDFVVRVVSHCVFMMYVLHR